MKSHAACGAKILETLKEKGIARIVRHHHERYDGEGYPDHLKIAFSNAVDVPVLEH